MPLGWLEGPHKESKQFHTSSRAVCTAQRKLAATAAANQKRQPLPPTTQKKHSSAHKYAPAQHTHKAGHHATARHYDMPSHTHPATPLQSINPLLLSIPVHYMRFIAPCTCSYYTARAQKPISSAASCQSAELHALANKLLAAAFSSTQCKYRQHLVAAGTN